MTTNPTATTAPIHYHAGHNMPGYLPESDVETFGTFIDAALFQVAELRHNADDTASWADDHDCDDIPCPAYSDNCPWQLSQAVLLEADELEDLVNRDSSLDGWSTHAGGLAYWINPCTDDCDLEGED